MLSAMIHCRAGSLRRNESMTSAILQTASIAQRTAAAAECDDSLASLQRRMLECAVSAASPLGLIRQLAKLVEPHAELLVIGYFPRNAEQRSNDARFVPAAGEGQPDSSVNAQLTACAHAACRRGQVETRRLVSRATCVAAPIVRRNCEPDAVGLVFKNGSLQHESVLLTQLVATHVELWHVLAEGAAAATDARDLAALLDLLGKSGTASGLQATCFAIVDGLKTYSGCGRVALGLRSRSGQCEVTAITGLSGFDRHSPSVRAMESAMDEALLRGELAFYNDAQTRNNPPVEKSLCELVQADGVASLPLRTETGVAIGAVLFFDDAHEREAELSRLLPLAEHSVAAALNVARKLEGGRLTRIGRALRDLAGSKAKGKVALAGALLLCLSMAVPLPYRIACHCQLEPVSRRFVVAPFEGTLEQTLVKPGDVVQHGDLLARMDDREVRWERASVIADRQQAAKKRDSAQATHNYAEAQIATLEMQRLDIRLQLLDDRSENLEIRSPVDGIVTAGELERAAGAPLTLGQTLFEIAPLNKMQVEAAVPDEEISRVREGQALLVRLDAFPGEPLQVPVAKVRPRSEIRDNENVFIAEATLDNADDRLRPGMKGRAKVVTDRRMLGWILFHRPWEFVTRQLHW